LSVAAALLLAPSANAAEGDEATRLLQQGIVGFDRGEFERSLELLTRASATAREPATLGQIQLVLGLNHAVLGRAARARELFASALSNDPRLRLDAERFKPALVRLFREVREELKGELSVSSIQPDASVFLNGQLAGKTPFLARVAIGAHHVRVLAKEGGEVHEEQVVVYPRKRVEVAAQLTSDETSPRRRRLWTWIAAAGAVACAGGGIGVWAWAGSDHDEFQETQDPARYEELKDSIRARDIAANVLFVTAGALAVTSAVLFFLEGRQPASERDASARRGLVQAGATGLSIQF
jgi:tetratricopeptide (TPR) repeat protein